MNEASVHAQNSYITLTYNDANLPSNHGLSKRDFQLFLKRMRKAVGQFRYFHCGEYGPAKGRPHYHALIFGYQFPDLVPHQEVRGNIHYRSALLESLWGKGFCTIGQVTFQSAAYVARYIMKKYNGANAEKIYELTDPDTGEVHKRIAEYVTMSRGRHAGEGIGGPWFQKFHDDVFPSDGVVLDGNTLRTPRYYDKLYERIAGEKALERVKLKRGIAARLYREHQTPERLAVRKRVLESKLAKLTREL